MKKILLFLYFLFLSSFIIAQQHDVSGNITSSDDGFNPHLVVACNLIEFSDSPIDNGNIITVTGEYFDHNPAVNIFPNPADEFVELTSVGRENGDEFYIRIMDITGKRLRNLSGMARARTLT